MGQGISTASVQVRAPVAFHMGNVYCLLCRQKLVCLDWADSGWDANPVAFFFQTKAEETIGVTGSMKLEEVPLPSSLSLAVLSPLSPNKRGRGGEQHKKPLPFLS